MGMWPAQMTPMGDRLLIKPREQERQTAGGVLLSGSAKQSLADGQVRRAQRARAGQLATLPAVESCSHGQTQR